MPRLLAAASVALLTVALLACGADSAAEEDSLALVATDATPTSPPALPTATATPEPTATALPPTATPTQTPGQATETSQPTATPTTEPSPTSTPLPTATPRPTATPTEEPAATPTPTNTPTVEPTSTPETQKVTSVIVGFRLQDLTIKAGTTVLWLQNDASIHTTTSGTPGSITDVWDSGNLREGETFSFTFAEPGEFPYFCAIHPSMRATVTVEGSDAAVSFDSSNPEATSDDYEFGDY